MNRRLLLLLAFLEGGLVMLLELTMPHVLAPALGNSIDTWAKMICLSVGGLAFGYYLGGYLLKKYKTSDNLLLNQFLLNAFFILFGIILIFNLNSSDFSLNEVSYSWVLAFLVLFLPTLIFGSTTPIIVALIHDQMQLESTVSGSVFSVSTLGGVCFTLFTGFYLIPEHGLISTLSIAVFLTLLIPLYVSIKNKKIKMTLLLSLLLIGNFVILFKKTEPETTKGLEILHLSEGLNGQLLVTEMPSLNTPGTNDRFLFINRMGQTWVNQSTGYSNWSYTNFVTAVGSMYPKNSKSLVLGLGGGIVAVQLDKFLNHKVDAVELDEKIIDISNDYFDLNLTNVQTYCDDARRFIKTSSEKYNLIVLDIFNGEIAPSHGLSIDSFEDIKKNLTSDGIIVINFNGFLSGKEGKSGRSLYKTLIASGYHVKIFPTTEKTEAERNNLFIAYLKEPDWTKCTIDVNTEKGKYKFYEHFISTSTLDIKDAVIISDDKPIMEYINKHAAKKWRESYLSNFTLKLKKENKLPLIK